MGVLLGSLQLTLYAIYPVVHVTVARGDEGQREWKQADTPVTISASTTTTISSSSSSSSSFSSGSSDSSLNASLHTTPLSLSRRLSVSLGVGGPAAKHLLVRKGREREEKEREENESVGERGPVVTKW